MLLLRYNKTEDDKDLDEAISRTRDAISGSTNCRPHRSPHPGSSGSSLLRKTITMLKGMYPIRGAVSADLAIQFSNLSNTLLRRHETKNNPTDLDKAIEYAREAVRATPKTCEVDLAERLRTLGYLLSRRQEMTHDEEDLYEADITAVKLEDLDDNLDVRH
ncbi:hypothetical protein F5B21DRAFT_506615 [Xylaria acuta]|nr:hypothetical protein F5B21DRAFT_506615 [Xylaria acuta]